MLVLCAAAKELRSFDTSLQQGTDASTSQHLMLPGAEVAKLPDYEAVLSAGRVCATTEHVPLHFESPSAYVSTALLTSSLQCTAAKQLRASDTQVQQGTDALTSQLQSPPGAVPSKLPDYETVASAGKSMP